jgi:DNA-binding NarL/FixJ family response regulator
MRIAACHAAVVQPPITVFFADDHPAWRRMVRSLLERARDVLIVGEAEDGAAALAALEMLQPDVAILDLDMPHEDGLAVIRSTRARDLPTRTILLTVASSPILLEEARRNGASGYVLKEDAAGDLVACVRTVHAGGSCFSPRLLAHSQAGPHRANR